MTVTINGTTGIAGTNGSAGTPAVQGEDTNTGIFFPAADTVAVATGGSERLRVDSSGNVGIGTNAPVSALHLASTAGPFITFQDNDAGANQPSIGTEGTAGSLIYSTGGTSASHIFELNRGASEAARIDSSGNLLVGTTTNISNAIIHAERSQAGGIDAVSRTLLNVSNSGATNTAKNKNLLVRVASNATNADVAIALTDAVTNNYWFGGNNGGAYVMANTNGVRLSSGGTSWASDSDERVKDIIEPISNAAEKVSTLRAVIGKYKTDSDGTRRAFLIAQDVQAVLPEAVFDEQGTLMLAYTETIPLLTAALQEALAEIANLKTRLTALEAK